MLSNLIILLLTIIWSFRLGQFIALATPISTGQLLLILLIIKWITVIYNV